MQILKFIKNKFCNESGASLAETPDYFTDPRDGKTYKTVKIGNKIWMAENLAYDGVENYCPDDDRDNVKKYGYLYTWENAKKACPTGWRLPTKEEFLALIGASDARDCIDILLTTEVQDTSWVSGATNSTGFSALPAGSWGGNGPWDGYGHFCGFGSYAGFWSSTSEGVCIYGLGLDYFGAIVKLYNPLNDALSVRCLKD